MSDVDDSRLQKLEGRIYHIDGDVSALKSQVTGIIGALQRIEENLLNRKPVWNTVSVLGAVSLLATLFVAMGGYMETQLNHVRDDVHTIQQDVGVMHEFRHQVHYEVGVVKQTLETNEKKWEHFDSLMHKRDDKINGLELGLSAHMAKARHD